MSVEGSLLWHAWIEGKERPRYAVALRRDDASWGMLAGKEIGVNQTDIGNHLIISLPQNNTAATLSGPRV
jgi:hypothetical protein